MTYYRAVANRFLTYSLKSLRSVSLSFNTAPLINCRITRTYAGRKLPQYLY